MHSNNVNNNIRTLKNPPNFIGVTNGIYYIRIKFGKVHGKMQDFEIS